MNLAGEDGGGEGLLQEGVGGGEDSAFDDFVIGVTADEESGNSRVSAADFIDDFASVFPRHDDIGDDEVDRVQTGLDQLIDFELSGGFEDSIAMGFEGELDDSADGIFVLDEEDGSGTANGFSDTGERRRVFDGYCGEEDAEGGSMPGTAVDVDPAPGLRDDAVDDRQPESGSLAGFLRGEKGFEDSGEDVFVDAESSVGDGHLNVGTGL